MRSAFIAAFVVFALYSAYPAHAEIYNNAKNYDMGEIVSKDCVEKTKDHADAAVCENEDLKKWQDHLAVAYADAKKRAEATEAEFKKMDSTQYEGMAKKLEASHESFLTYMKNQCEYEVSLMGAGTAAMDVEPLCQIRLISYQLHYIETIQ